VELERRGTNWREKYRKLKIRYLQLQARYYRALAKLHKGETVAEGYVTKEEYYKLLSRYKILKAKLNEIRLKKEEEKERRLFGWE